MNNKDFFYFFVEDKQLKISNIEELIENCITYPNKATEYLDNQDFEKWLKFKRGDKLVKKVNEAYKKSDKKRLKKFITILQIHCIKDICKKELKSKKNISLSNFELELKKYSAANKIKALRINEEITTNIISSYLNSNKHFSSPKKFFYLNRPSYFAFTIFAVTGVVAGVLCHFLIPEWIVSYSVLFTVILGIWISLIAISGRYWSGFSDRTTWQWLDLLIVPLVLIVAAYSLDINETRRQTNNTNIEYENQLVLSYLEQVRNLLLNQDYVLEENSHFSDIHKDTKRKSIESLTISVLSNVREERKKLIINFLRNTELITLDSDLAKKSGSGLDTYISLRGADLTNIDFKNEELRNINFRGSFLYGSDFSNADLRKSDFNYALFDKRVKFNRANLKGAKFDDAVVIFDKNKKTSLGFSDFLELINKQRRHLLKKYKNTTYENLNFSEIDLSGVDFTKSAFVNSIFRKTNLEESNLTSVVFNKTKIKETNLIKAKLGGANFSEAEFIAGSGNNPIGATIDESTKGLPEHIINLINAAPASNVSFIDRIRCVEEIKIPGKNKESLENPEKIIIKYPVKRAEDCKSREIEYQNAFLKTKVHDDSYKTIKVRNFNNSKETDLRQKIARLEMQKLDLKYADLTSADLTSADLTGADLTGADLTNTILNHANLSKAKLDNAKFINSQLIRASLVGVQSDEGVSFEGSNLRSAIFYNKEVSENTSLNKANFFTANLQCAQLQKVNFTGSSFDSTNLHQANFEESTLDDTSFVGAQIWKSSDSFKKIKGKDETDIIKKNKYQDEMQDNFDLICY
ncbi:MAG: pentapeptide repeat-containing protein [Cyanobacteria bacterium P01_G01_bin.39]